jgi:hypothetical protein
MPRPKTTPKPPAWDEDEPDIIEAVGVAPTPRTPDPDLNYMMDSEYEPPVTALVVAPQSNSVIVGLGALASMSDAEYEAKKLVMQRGLARVKDIQQSLMVDKEDYGKVPGIAKPFLQLPGAEKLANFYGYAVRQEADRVVRGVNDSLDVPPLAYHVRSYVHLGSFDGPVVAMGYGEANSYEEKYRWRWAKATCPPDKGGCGREGLIRGRAEGPLKGRWWCPGKEGGCNRKWEPGDIPPPGKVENTEPYGLAETLIQIAGKRSFVASIRRATGTSGLFSQDDDLPSVQQQSADSGAPDPSVTEPVVAAAPSGVVVSVGAKSDGATEIQRKRLGEQAKAKGLNGTKMADLMNRLFGMEVEPTGAAASAAAKTLNGVQMGQLLMTIETGEISEQPDPKESGIILEADRMPV